ncbi:MAG: hypothetical protein WCC30_07695, partial [Candidatus Dormiibacterota bacterium]
MQNDPPRPVVEPHAHPHPAPSAGAPATRGHLKIYLGATPGAGKTFAMLREAHELIRQGHDVVVAYVET